MDGSEVRFDDDVDVAFVIIGVVVVVVFVVILKLTKLNREKY